MSKYVDEIVQDIRINPETWKRSGSTGLEKANIIITGFNSNGIIFLYLLSIVDVYINGISTFSTCTYMDKVKLQLAYNWWMRSSPLSRIEKK